MTSALPTKLLRGAVFALSIVFLLPPAGAGAQERAREDAVFEGLADVVEVQVPVNVVGRDGVPVRGLTAEDFVVLDRGDRREITGFEVIDLEVLEPAPGAAAEVTEQIPSAARRHFLLLFDLTFASPAAVTKAREAAREFVLRELHPSDLVAVATFSMDFGARLVVTFTPDRAQLARAVDTLGAPRLLEQQAAVDPLRFMIVDPERSSMSSSFSQTSGANESPLQASPEVEVQAYLNVIANEMDKAERSYERGQVASWMGSLGELAKALGSVQGRKHVVLFSEGFDGRLMLGRGPDAWDPDAERDRLAISTGQHWFVDTDEIYGNTALQNHVTRMLEEFRRNDCIIQAVDISGLGSESARERRAATVGQDALFYLANETGGTLFEDTNDLGRDLRDVLERSAVTYVLAFQPDEVVPDGSYHRLRVELRGDRRRGTTVTHREGYYAPRPFEDLHPLEKSLLASDAIASAADREELDLDVLAAPFRAGPGHAYVPVIIEVDGKKLLADQEVGTLAAEIYVYVSDRDGQMRDFFTQLVSLDLSEEGRAAMRETGLKYYGHLDLEPGRYLVRVLVRNAGTGRTGVRSVRVEVPEYGEELPQILPPFFLEPMGRWVLVREKASAGSDTVVYPFTVNGSPFVPSARPEIRRGEEADFCLVGYNLPDGELEIEGTVVTEEGEELDVGSLSLDERTVTGLSGVDKLLGHFRVDHLASGSYTLRVGLHQPDTGLTQFNSIPFRVHDRSR